MILERRSILPPTGCRPTTGRSSLYPLNRFSDIIELARLNEAWLLRCVNGKIAGKMDEEDEGMTMAGESKRHFGDITLPAALSSGT